MRNKLIYFSWILCSTLFANTVKMSEPLQQGHAAKKVQMMHSYNQPASYNIQDETIEIFVNTSFIYWQAREEGLAYGLTNPTGDINGPPNQGGELLDLNFRFKPGFKVGLGLHLENDNWDVYAEYTRFHQTITSSSTVPNTANGIITSLFNPINASLISARWKLEMDILDFEVGRAYYVGLGLTFRPHFGGRAAWIDQKYDVTNDISTTGRAFTEAKTNSWALGPRFAIDSNWLFGLGFRMIATSSFSLLYSRYKFSLSQFRSPVSSVFSRSVTAKNSFLRPVLEISMGLGWGTYFCKNKYHVDLTASYDFNTYWNQNMIRYFMDLIGFSGSFGDLYTHGLNITGRFDF